MNARFRLFPSGRNGAGIGPSAGLRVALGLVVALALSGCTSKVRSPGAAVQVTPPVTAPAPSARIDTAPAPPVAGDTIQVAALLPLSGPNAALGRSLLDAAQLAVFELADERFTLVPRDTRGTAEGATAAARAAIDDGARLIVGPVFSTEVAAVAAVARPAGVTVLSLSNDVAAAAPGVFILGITPGAQVERVVEFARTRGLARYAAMVPNNGYGAAVEMAFLDAVHRVDGQVVAVERYEPGATDVSPIVRRLADYEARSAALKEQKRALEGRNDEISRQALRRLESVDTVGEVAFDAILLPDFGDRLLTMAPLLPYYDIDPARVRFLGTSLWDDPRVTREPALAGAWFAAPPPEAREAFAKRYRELYRREPPRLATIAYDAVAIAAVLGRTDGVPDFSPGTIANPVGFAGMDGVFRLRPDGSVERNLAVIEVRPNGFRTVSPASDRFTTPTQ